MARRIPSPDRRPEGEHPAAEHPKTGGWHPVEWLSELVGTFVLLLAIFLLIATVAGPLSPLPDSVPMALRLVLIGVLVGLVAAVVAISPLGRRSGAHLNPALTIGFWAHGETHWHDLLGYIAAQLLGAILAAVVFATAAGPLAESIAYAQTEPVVNDWAAAGVELVLTCALVLTIFFMLSSRRTCRWTPLAVTVALVVLILAGASLTGPSLNPARSIAPGVVTWSFMSLWPYLAGPTLGALLAAALFPLLTAGKKLITAKLFHDPRYPCVHTSRWQERGPSEEQ